MGEILYRTLHSPAEMEQAVELQKGYWGDDGLALVPAHMLLSIANYGGQVIGAYDGDDLIGVLIGFIGADIDADDEQSAAARLLVMSKRMIVLPQYRSQKIGEHLKWLQRDYALRHGIQLVTWTFDPLLARNAYLNLHKLGAVGQHYQINYFGASAAHPNLSADRLAAHWWIRHPHAQPSAPRTLPDDAQPFNRVQPFGDFIAPTSLQAIQPCPAWLLEIPADFSALQSVDPTLAADWRAHIREAMTSLLQAGCLASDFLRHEGRTFYVFTPDDGTFAFTP
jgi:predicted GNAT superfamily acetyltransferase